MLEHVHDPAQLLDRFVTLVRPGGVIGIMTGLIDDAGCPFEDWWYRRDPTHVCFYSRATMEWIARGRQWDVEFPVPNGVLLST